MTSKEVEQRWFEHVGDSKKGSERLFHRALRKYGIDCWELKILHECKAQDEAFALEVSSIDLYKTFAYEYPELGYNMTKGGEGSAGHVHKHTDEAKQKISKALRERVVSDETRKKISETRVGIVFSEETIKKMSESHAGKILSEETKRKMSEARIGLAKSEDHKRKIGAANRGKIHSEESRKNMSDSRRGIKQTQETKDKRAQSLREYHRRKAESEKAFETRAEDSCIRIKAKLGASESECDTYIEEIDGRL